MSAIFGETLTFGYDGGEVRLVAFGDEHYHRLETPDGYTAVYDGEQRRYCYALVLAGRFVSTGIPVEQRPPDGLRRHLREASSERQRVRDIRRTTRLPPRTIDGSAATLRTFGAANGLLPGRRCSTGDVVGLTILVRFRDVDTTVTADDVDQMLNRPGYDRNGNSGSARDYFLRVSNGRLRYQNLVVGPYTLAHDRSHYVDQLLLREALDLAVADGLDLRQFDSKHENVVDAINVLYAGQTQYIGNLWPHNGFDELRYGPMRTGLYLLTSLGRTATDLSIGTFCHENGHLLCRFPDMYDYGERDSDGVDSAGIGSYCLMGSGNHLDHGRTPSPVCGYLRELAGWCEVVDLRSGSDFEAVHGDYGKVMKWETGRPNEYFIVENRSKLDQDRGLPSSGLAVYHCDVLGSNEWQDGSAARHYQCALLQADGRLDLERNVNQGDGADLWSAVAGMALGHATTPSSRQWDGGESGLILSAITPPGARIGFRVGAPSRLRLVRGDALPSVPIPDDNVAGVASTIAIAETGGVMSVAVSVDIAHTYVGDLVVELIAPDGRRAVLHDRSGGGKDDLITTFRSESVGALAALVGVDARGSWRLVVRDAERVDVGVLRRWSIELALEAASPPVLRGEAAPAVAIPENDPVGVGSAIALRHPGAVGSLQVRVAIAHPYVGDLRVELLSPAGRRVILHNRLGGGQDDLTAAYRSDNPGSPLAPLVGQAIEGSWVLRVADLAPRDRGTLTGWSIEVVPAP